jgi:hypothetical protein
MKKSTYFRPDRQKERTDVYRIYDDEGLMLYVGISYDACIRIRQHARTAAWWEMASRISVTTFADRWTAAKEEAFTIMMDAPPFNIGRDPVAEEAAWMDANSPDPYYEHEAEMEMSISDFWGIRRG